MEVKFNEERALEIFRILEKLWIEKTGIFKDVVLPQDYWPLPKDSKDKANYFFFAALPMRGGVISEDPFKWIHQLNTGFPEMFNPEIVAKEWTPQRIEKAIKSVTPIVLNGQGINNKGVGIPGYKIEEHSRAWYENAVKLSTYWGNDLRNVFWGVTEFGEAFRRIDRRVNSAAGFRGMRRKIFSLMIIWLQEKKLIPIFPTPLPVDFHVLRIFWATRVADIINEKPPKSLEKYFPTLVNKPAIRIRESLLNTITKWSQGFLIKEGLSHLSINPALWVLSREFCAGHFQNSSQNDGTIFFDEDKLRANPKLWPKNYRNPCQHCPIEKFCTGAVPAAPYYRRAFLVRFERVPYLTSVMPGVDWFSFFPHPGRKRTKRNKH